MSACSVSDHQVPCTRHSEVQIWKQHCKIVFEIAGQNIQEMLQIQFQSCAEVGQQKTDLRSGSNQHGTTHTNQTESQNHSMASNPQNQMLGLGESWFPSPLPPSPLASAGGGGNACPSVLRGQNVLCLVDVTLQAPIGGKDITAHLSSWSPIGTDHKRPLIGGAALP